jgi:metal-responsive CopG/Arc/MetJ family transcriptional regulator
MKREKRRIKRGAIRRENCIFVGAWVPDLVVEAIDGAVQRMDLDRSKFLRKALEEKISKEAK